jgi:hypothetical protein
MLHRSSYTATLIVVALFLLPPLVTLLLVIRQLPAAHESSLRGPASPTAIRLTNAAGNERAVNRFPARLR